MADLAVPTIAQTTTIGGVPFQISYGHDSGGLLTAILAPVDASNAALHFTVLGKTVDANQAVVTLTFAYNLKSVTIDPGYVGSVQVDSHRLRQHSLSDDVPSPRLMLSHDVAASLTPSATPAPDTATAPVQTPVASAEPVSTPTVEVKNPLQPLAPATMASQLAPSILSSGSDSKTDVAHSDAKPATSTDSASATQPAVATERIKLYWAEPVTAPDGTAPACAADEIKLVEVHGSVSVTLPNGQTQPGAEGMTIPSGSAVATEDNASAALFLGGINSARLAPRCDLTITESFDGAVRKDTIDLRSGAVFSRVGKRAGEVEDYQVRTPEGVTAADTPNMLAFRGSASDIPAIRTAMDSGTILDESRLLAWNPVTLGRNLVSDVANPLFGAPTAPSTVFYYAPNTSLNLSQVKNQVLASNASNGSNSPNANDPNTILQGILLTIAPFNLKLNSLLTAVNGGKATGSELAYYHSLITVFFNVQVPSISSQLTNIPGTANQTSAGIRASSLALLRDLQPFNVPRATPF